jgi:lipase chaperone LimK
MFEYEKHKLTRQRQVHDEEAHSRIGILLNDLCVDQNRRIPHQNHGKHDPQKRQLLVL